MKVASPRVAQPRVLAKRAQINYDDPEVQVNMFYIASELAYQAGLPILGNFMQCQAGIAEQKAGSDQQDKQLLLIENNSRATVS